MTKESILKRLFFNNQITLDELLVLVDAKYKKKNKECEDNTTKSNQFKPYETRELAGSDKPISAAAVARETLKSVSRGKYAIVPGAEAKLLYFLGTRLGNWVYPVMDRLLAGIAKKKARLGK